MPLHQFEPSRRRAAARPRRRRPQARTFRRRSSPSGPDVGFFEIHAENYMGDGGPPHRRLEAIRALYPLSLHGVGLSIGGPRPLDQRTSRRLAALASATSPGCSPSISPGRATTRLSQRPAAAALHRGDAARRLRPHRRDAGGGRRRMLLENPSTYVRFAESDIPETEFLPRSRAAPAAGCCSTSTMSRSRPAITASTRAPISTHFRSKQSGRSTSPAMPRRADDAGDPLRIDAHDSPVRAERLGALPRSDRAHRRRCRP